MKTPSKHEIRPIILGKFIFSLKKIHEIKIKNAVNNKRDELKGIKVTLKSNKAPIFQNMIIKHQEPEEETTPMILMVEEVIKVEDTELSNTVSGAEEWSETDSRWTDDTEPPPPALMAEIEQVLSMKGDPGWNS